MTPERASLATREAYEVVYQVVYRHPLYKRYIQQKGHTIQDGSAEQASAKNANECSRIHESYSHWNPSMNVCISSHVRVPPILCVCKRPKPEALPLGRPKGRPKALVHYILDTLAW